MCVCKYYVIIQNENQQCSNKLLNTIVGKIIHITGSNNSNIYKVLSVFKRQWRNTSQIIN